ncbi:MAG TPA: acyl-CoA dehydrogenase family protein, partial [Burkholderiales bacterium]|nr:acyl-CoA dehydrogenase family protein [Burkholderiales bacterium]
MNFAYTPEQEALRSEVRAFLAREMTPQVLADMEEHNEGRPFHRSSCRTPAVSALFQKIVDRCWVGISYPKEYGGQGGDRISQYIVEEELHRANISVALGGSGAPAIMAAGTEAQKREFIPKLITGEYMFAQGF